MHSFTKHTCSTTFATLSINKSDEILWIKTNKPIPHIIFIGKAVFHLTGFSSNKFYQTNDLWMTVVHQADKKAVKSFYKNKQNGKTEYRIINKKGEVRWVSETCYFQEETNVDFGIISDITKQKELEKLEALILHSFNKFNLSFSIRYAKSGKLLLAASSCELFGMPTGMLHENMKQYWLENIVHPEDKAEQAHYIATDNFPTSRRYRILHPMKGERQIEVKREKIKYYGEDYIIVFIEDATDKIKCSSIQS